jgi:hypothetical protein
VVDIAMITMATASTTTAQIGTELDEDPVGSVTTTAFVVGCGITEFVVGRGARFSVTFMLVMLVFGGSV